MGAPVGFVIAALVLLVFSVGFVTMTPHVSEAGAFFSYVTTGLDSRAGLGVASVALAAYTAIEAGVYGYLGWSATTSSPTSAARRSRGGSTPMSQSPSSRCSATATWS